MPHCNQQWHNTRNVRLAAGTRTNNSTQISIIHEGCTCTFQSFKFFVSLCSYLRPCVNQTKNGWTAQHVVTTQQHLKISQTSGCEGQINDDFQCSSSSSHVHFLQYFTLQPPQSLLVFTQQCRQRWGQRIVFVFKRLAVCAEINITVTKYKIGGWYGGIQSKITLKKMFG